MMIRVLSLAAILVLVTCADDRPYLSGHIKRATDAILTPCDPYNRGDLHSCVVYASVFSQKLVVYDASAEEMVLSPMVYFPLAIKVGSATSDLALIKGSKKPPFFLALDHSEPAVYVIRNFPSADKSQLSFAKASKLKLTINPASMAAYLSPTHAVVILSYPDSGELELLSFDQNSGLRDESVAPERIKVGSSPTEILINDEANIAYIIDAGSSDVWSLDLVSKTPRPIKVGGPVDQIFHSQRDLGAGSKNYLAVLSKANNELRLINADDNIIEANLIVDEYPMTVYFPDTNAQPCCDGEKNWLAVAGIKGKLFTIPIKQNAGKLSLEKPVITDLTSEKNLVLSKLHLRKILGGKIEFDASLNRPVQCPNGRNIYFISSYGSDRVRLLGQESYEVEAQGYACEGEASASRLGYKKE